MHLFYNASQIIKMVILVDLSAMFLASPLSILAWEFGKCMPFQSCSVLFRDLVNLLLSCFSQTNHSNTIMSTHAKVLCKNTSFRISPTTGVAPENFDDPVYIVNPQSRVFFTMVDQTTSRHAFQVFTAFHLAHYKCPERHFHNEILEIDRYTHWSPPF